MYSHRFGWSVFLMSCALGSVLISYVAQSRGIRPTLAKSSVTKSLYLIVSSHRPGECSKAIDAVAALDPAELGQWNWGCSSGDHTGYLMAEAENQQAALILVPETLRSRARVIKLDKYSPAMLSSIGGQR
jgi:hypothetical protein